MRLKKIIKNNYFTGVGFLLICFFVLTKLSYAAEDKIVAVVNGEAITQGDVDEFLSALYFQLYSQYDPAALEAKMQEAKNEAVDMLVENQLMIQEAAHREYVASNDLVEKELEDIKAAFASEKDFQDGLILKGLTLAELKKKIFNKLIMRYIVEDEVRSKIFVHPQEVTDYYNQHKEEFNTGESFDLDSIFVPFNGKEDEAKQKAYDALAALKNFEDFIKVQEKYSEMSSLGVVSPAQLRPELQEVLKTLAVGDVSLPIRVDNGFFILKVKNKTASRIKEVSEVSDVISGYLFQRKFEERFTEWIDQLKTKAFILIK